MTILSIDASTQTAGAALLTEKYIIAECNINAREIFPSSPSHSETLLPAIHDLFCYTGFKLDDIDFIACVCGPGSFTGLRIGAATAMGIAKGADIPLVPVPTLDSLAYNVVSGEETLGACNVSSERFLPQAKRQSVSGEETLGRCVSGGHTVERNVSLIAPIMDARRGQVYTALYCLKSGKPKRLTDYLAEDIKDVLPMILRLNCGNVTFLGDGADTYKDIIKESIPAARFAPLHASRCRAASAGMRALDMLNEGFRPVTDFELLYVRKPQAVRDRERKSSV